IRRAASGEPSKRYRYLPSVLLLELSTPIISLYYNIPTFPHVKLTSHSSSTLRYCEQVACVTGKRVASLLQHLLLVRESIHKWIAKYICKRKSVNLLTQSASRGLEPTTADRCRCGAYRTPHRRQDKPMRGLFCVPDFNR